MRTNEFIWTDPCGLDHKIQIDFVITYGDEGDSYLSKTEYYIDSVIDGSDGKLRTFCEGIANKCLQMCHDLDFGWEKINSTQNGVRDFLYEKSNATYGDILTRAKAELENQYPDLYSDIYDHNNMIEEGRRRLGDKYK